MTSNRNIFQTGKLAAVLSVAVLAATTALAQAPGDQNGGPGMGPHHPPMERAFAGGEHGRWWNDAHAIDKFKLTDTQRKSMDDIFQQHRLTLIDLRGTLEKSELAMEPMMQEDQPDEGKILSQIDRIAQARAELEKANARMLFDLRKQLTPEQWKLIQADRAAHHGPGGPGGPGAHWHGKGGPGGPGSPDGPAGQDAPPPPGGAASGPGAEQ